MTMLKIETGNGIYEVKKPGGKLGAKSMMMFSELASVDGVQPVPKMNVDGTYEGNEDPKLVAIIQVSNQKLIMAKMESVFVRWASEILPSIIATFEGKPFAYEDMPGEDQLAVFLAISGEMKMTQDFFRIIPPTPSG
jgi:hypothetical protein